MKILDYEYSGEAWRIGPARFQDVNLIVGDSGAGKTRLFNTMFNLGTHVAQGSIGSAGSWNLTLQADEHNYRWSISVASKDNEIKVESESLTLNDDQLIDRSRDHFVLRNDPELPRLPSDQLSVSILKEEPDIQPVFDGFAQMLRRKFFTNTLEENSNLFAMNEEILAKIGATGSLRDVYKANLPLNPRLYILSEYFPDIYDKIVNSYTETFDFLREATVLDSTQLNTIHVPGRAHVFCIKEAHVDGWLRLDELSSGMQKVLLILTDIYSLPPGSIYILDEYENSLGVGAINFLPDVLLSEQLPLQVFISSHHPYIIDKFPVSTWYVVHRKGSKVSFDYGQDLEERYGISKQAKYLQLLNDPRYSEGIQ